MSSLPDPLSSGASQFSASQFSASILSGVLSSSGAFPFSGLIRSGVISFGPLASGAFATGVPSYACAVCGVHTANTAPLILVAGFTYCSKCAGFSPEQGFGWDTWIREKCIRESTPFEKDTPLGIIGDWCEDNNRYEDAAWIRNRVSTLDKECK